MASILSRTAYRLSQTARVAWYGGHHVLAKHTHEADTDTVVATGAHEVHFDGIPRQRATLVVRCGVNEVRR